jgi:localization factor PodJL
MKFGGPWNLRGLRPEAREAARDAARQSGMSVGEWLNDVIRPEEEDYGERTRYADVDDDRGYGGYREPEPEPEPDYAPRRGRRDRDLEPDQDRNQDRNLDRNQDRYADRNPDRNPPRIREAARAAAHARDEERHAARAQAREAAWARQETRAREATCEELRQAAREEARHATHAEEARLVARARSEMGEVHARLDKLSHQLERLARPEAPRLTGAPPSPHRDRMIPNGRPHSANHPMPGSTLSVDDAIAEIAERQRTLYGEAPMPQPMPPPRAPVPFFAPQSRPPEPLPEAAPEPASFSAKPPQPLPAAVAPPAAPSIPAAPALDISKLEEQLRNITARIETLRPSNDLDEVISAFRKDLADISRQITEALPRHAVESLQIEVQALAQRIDHSRDTGVDSSTLVGLERGLVEEALQRLTPAENLVGFDDAVRTLAQKVDLIIAKEDPATLQQLETAIGALRGIVSHVASNDTLTKVAEDVRALAARVDEIANSAASGHAVSALESRIDTLTNALSASAEAGHAVPRELEKLLSGLIEKLEWVQLTHTDHAALGHLEDRIAQLIKRLDVSDARLGNLAAVERGLADLLVHIDEARARGGAVGATVGAGGGAMGGTAGLASTPQPVAVDAIKRDVAEIKRSDRRTQDSLEAVHGAVEHVVDRLAMIESGMHEVPPPPTTVTPQVKSEAPVTKPAPIPLTPAAAAPTAMAPTAMTIAAPKMPLAPAEPSSFEAAPRRMTTAAPRAPIDPNLPPDHPLEPGSTPGSRAMSGAMPSAADRIAASEAAAGLAEPPSSTAVEEKPNYLTAARKAAQAAAAAPADRKSKAAKDPSRSKGRSQRLRKLLVAGGAVVVAALCVHIVLHMFQDNNSSAISPPPLPEQSTDLPPEKDSAVMPPPPATMAPPIPGASADAPPSAAPSQPLNITPDSQPRQNPATPPPAPQRQSASPDTPDVTGALPRRVPPPNVAPYQAPVAVPFQAIPVPAAAVDTDKLPATIGGPTLRAAAAAGDAAAEYEVATRFAEGHGVPVSNEQAVHWLQRAADQGSAPAEFRLGGLYEKGIGVKKDLGKARDLYAAASDKGNGKAMHNLAVLYAEGINAPADYRTAALWFRKAADRGITDSQYNLAILYARGIGVEQNYAESYKWFTLAANRGDGDAGKKRDEVASHLDKQSLDAVQAAVQKWAAVAQPDEALNVRSPPGGWDPASQAAKPAKPKPAGAKPEAKL